MAIWLQADTHGLIAYLKHWKSAIDGGSSIEASLQGHMQKLPKCRQSRAGSPSKRNASDTNCERSRL